MTKYFKLNENKNAIHQNMQDTAKALIREQLIALND